MPGSRSIPCVLVYPLWNLQSQSWTTVTMAEARRLVPHINIKQMPARVTSLRVFQSGSVIIVSRWPVEMAVVHDRFRDCMERYRREVMDPQFAKQRTIESCWYHAV